jgi:redox-sensing transcriptional repressor
MNFAPTVLNVPQGVNVRKVDLALELQILSYYEQCRNTVNAAPADTSTGAVSA